MNRPLRILFVVQGSVSADEGVLELARLMSAAGWVVLVLGWSSGRTGRDWRVEDVRVREVPVARQRPRGQARNLGFSWRRPLAYRNRDVRRDAVTRAALWRLEQCTRLGADGSVPLRTRLWYAAGRRLHRLRDAQYKSSSLARPPTGGRRSTTGRRRTAPQREEPELARVELARVELAFARAIARFRPHVIHASTAETLTLAVRAADRQSLRLGRPKVVFNAREIAAPRPPRGVDAVIVADPSAVPIARANEPGVPPKVAVIGPEGSGSGVAESDWRHLGRGVDALFRELLGTGPDADLALRSELALDLFAGNVPPIQLLLRCVRAHLHVADIRLSAADVDSAARWTSVAAGLLFHRALHFDGAASPLSDSPETFLAHWHGSDVYGRFARLDGVTRIQTAKKVERIVIATHTNAAFVPALRAELDAVPGLVVDALELSEVDLAGAPMDLNRQLRARLADPASPPEAWVSQLQRVVGPADILWVEWAQRAAVLLSMTELPVRRRIVRLHSYEAFLAYPHVVDWSRIDDVVFVGPHIRDLVLSELPALRSAGTRTHVIPIGIHAANWLRTKSPDARWTLGLVGWSTPAKVALWALDVLARVREVDPRFRLRLVGGQPPDGSPAVARYRASVVARAQDPDVAGAVEFRSQTADVSGELVEIGFILSSSNREALHLGLIEGAASGGVPVVRDWPLVRKWNGPRRLFPADWVVSDVEEAAARILAIAGDDRGYRAAGLAAAKYAEETYDHRVVGEAMRQLILAAPTD